MDSKVSRVAWLNRTTILFAGEEKWSLDPRVILLDTVQTEYSIKIENVDLQDEGPYVCSILSDKLPKSTKVHLIVQGKLTFLQTLHLKACDCVDICVHLLMLLFPNAFSLQSIQFKTSLSELNIPRLCHKRPGLIRTLLPFYYEIDQCNGTHRCPSVWEMF